MALPTRATLRTNARIFADQDQSDFPSDAQYNVYMDLAARETWWDLRVAGWPVNFSSTTVTANGSTTYALSAASPAVTVQVASLHGVYFQQGADFYPVNRINEGKRAALISSSFQPTGYAGFYDFRVDPVNGPIVELLPKPTSGTYRVDYIAEHPGFSGDSDTWYGPAGTDTLLSLKAAIYGVDKEGPARAAEADRLRDQYAKMLQKVTDRATWLDMRNPAQIRDVSSENARYSFDYPVAGPMSGSY